MVPLLRFPIDLLIRAGLVMSVLFAPLSNLSAHDLFAAFIQHRVALEAGAKYVDVTVQLTFFEEGSEHEREHMDSDQNGRISYGEVRAYLQRLEPTFEKATSLRIDGNPVPLIPLYPADLDLLNEDRVGQGHLRLTLSYFAPTPAGLQAGAEFVVEDRLWPKIRALGSIQARGKDGIQLEAIPPSDPVFPVSTSTEARTFKARLINPPISFPSQASH